MSRACPVAVALGVLLAASPGRADEIAPYDVSAVKDALRLLTDGKGHYVALVPLARCLKDADRDRDAKVSAVFYGDGAVFHHLRSPGGGASCGEQSFDVLFWEPRVVHRGEARLELRGGQYLVRCGDRQTELRLVAAAESRARVAAAKFFTARWPRTAYALARDDQGTYYYVDVLADRQRGRDFRLYVGPRGSLKLQRMKNIVSDSEGDIFSTDRGELRLVLSRDEAAWIRGRKRTKLLPVPVDRNVRFIYAELGPYVGERLGTPCDDL